MAELNKWFYNLAYCLGKPRWDSGAVPPEVKGLADCEQARTALDLGCGTGTNAIYLAQQGLHVVGIDFTPKAIEIARERANQVGVDVEFAVGDVTHLESLEEPFDLVFDIGCYHGLDTAGRWRYVEQLARLTHPGSTYLMWAFEGKKYFGRYGVTSAQVRQEFGTRFMPVRIRHLYNPATGPGAWFWLARRCQDPGQDLLN